MNIAKEQLDDLNAVIRLSIQNDDYESRVNDVLKDYRKKVNMPGFRPGKVPAGLVKQMYGKAVLVDEINKLVSENLSKFITENELNILGEPLPSESQKTIDFDKSDDFEFAFDVALAPELEVKLTKREKINYYQIDITDYMMDGYKKNLTSRFGKTEPREEAGEDSILKGEFTQLDKDGNALEGGITAKDSMLSLAVLKDEKVKAQFIGAKVGDVVTFDPKTAFPNETEVSYLLKITKEQADELTGNLSFSIQEITEYIDPELNQELFDQLFGQGAVNNEEEFTTKVKEDLERTHQMESDYKFSLDVKKKLMAKLEVALPEEFLKRWLKATNQNEEQVTDEQIEKEMPRFLDDLKWQLIRNEIVKSNDLKIENEEVVNFAKKSARMQFMQYGLNSIPDDYLDNYVADMLQKEDQQRTYAEGAINDKVMAFIKEAIKLETKEVSREEFNTLFEGE
jgi:trigger factor